MWTLLLSSISGMANAYVMRTNMSVAIVSMVRKYFDDLDKKIDLKIVRKITQDGAV